MGRAACISKQPGCIHLGVPQHARSGDQVSASVGWDFAHCDWNILI